MNVVGIGDGSGYGGLAGEAPAGSPAVPMRGGTGQSGGFGGDVFEPSVTGLEAEVGAAELTQIRAALTQIVEMSPVGKGEVDPIRGVLRQVDAALVSAGATPGKAGAVPGKAAGAAAAWVSEAAEDAEVAKLLGEERPSVLDAALVKLAVYEKGAPVSPPGEGTAPMVRVGAQVADASMVASTLGAAEAARLASQFELTRRAEAGWGRPAVERPRLRGRPSVAKEEGARRRRRAHRGGTAEGSGRRRRRRGGPVGLASFCGAIGRAAWAWWQGLFGRDEPETGPRGFASGYRGEE